MEEQHVNRNSKETDNSTSSDDPDKDDPEDFHKQKKSSKIKTNLKSAARKESRWYVYTYLLGVAVAALVALLYSLVSSASEDNSFIRTEDQIKSQVQVWQRNYPNQNHETWCTIAGQMMDFVGVGHMSPLVFVMAYKGAPKTTQMLASEISRAALEFKNNIDKCGDMDIAKISGSDKRIKPGFLLNHYIKQVEKCRKMIMHNLEELDGSAAKDLHSLLDPDFPNLHNVVYIFTVKIPNSEGNVYKEVQKTLRNNWSPTIEDDKLNPLLSRLVNNVKIIPEPIFEY